MVFPRLDSPLCCVGLMVTVWSVLDADATLPGDGGYERIGFVIQRHPSGADAALAEKGKALFVRSCIFFRSPCSH
jgi:hypothetical protein